MGRCRSRNECGDIQGLSYGAVVSHVGPFLKFQRSHKETIADLKRSPYLLNTVKTVKVNLDSSFVQTW